LPDDIHELLWALDDAQAERQLAELIAGGSQETVASLRTAWPALADDAVVRLAILLAESQVGWAHRLLVEIWGRSLGAYRQNAAPVPPWQLSSWRWDRTEQQLFGAVSERITSDWEPDEAAWVFGEAITDREPGIRAAAADMAGLWHGRSNQAYPPALERALAVAAGDPDPGVREAAVWSLSLAPSSASAAALEQAAGDPSGPVRAGAISALGRLADPGARFRVLAALGDQHPWVRIAALHSLEVTAPEVARAEAVRLLEDPDAWVRQHAGAAHARLSGSR